MGSVVVRSLATGDGRQQRGDPTESGSARVIGQGRVDRGHRGDYSRRIRGSLLDGDEAARRTPLGVALTRRRKSHPQGDW